MLSTNSSLTTAATSTVNKLSQWTGLHRMLVKLAAALVTGGIAYKLIKSSDAGWFAIDNERFAQVRAISTAMENLKAHADSLNNALEERALPEGHDRTVERLRGIAAERYGEVSESSLGRSKPYLKTERMNKVISVAGRVAGLGESPIERTYHSEVSTGRFEEKRPVFMALDAGSDAGKAAIQLLRDTRVTLVTAASNLERTAKAVQAGTSHAALDFVEAYAQVKQASTRITKGASAYYSRHGITPMELAVDGVKKAVGVSLAFFAWDSLVG